MVIVFSKLRALNFIPIISLIGIIASTLIISEVFIYRSLTPFYLYLLGISALLTITGFSLAISARENVAVSGPILISLLLACYVALHGFFLLRNFNPFHISLVFDCCVIVSVFVLVQLKLLKGNVLFHGITILAIIESLICIGQYFKLLPGFNSYFAVTGTWENPNVTAMFLAMSVPALAAIKNNKKYIVPAIVLLVFVAVLLLQCRTAVIGIVVTGLFFLKHRYGGSDFFSARRNRPLTIVTAIFLVAVLIPIGGYFYNAKKASADGRTLIWKLSAEMVLRKPLLGYGYGSFEKEYNLFQSDYFKGGNGSAEELAQAGFVRMGYNEFLQNTVEGGLIGLLLISGLFITLLSVPIFKKIENGISYSIAYAGITSFAVMSLVNFSFQAIPVVCLFSIYAGLLASHPSFKKISPLTKSAKQRLWYKLALSSCFILSGLYTFDFNVITARDSLLNKRAAVLNSKGNSKEALQTVIPLAADLYNYESYWSNYGDILVSMKDNTNALDKFKKAEVYTANPEIYLKSALCYQTLGKYKLAENDYMVAEYAEPSRLTPKYDLMAMYLRLKDTSNAGYMAKQIMAITPKIKTSEASFYKYQAYALLKQLGISHTTQVNYFNQQRNKTNTTFN